MTIYDLKFIHCPFHHYYCIAVEFCSAELEWWFMTCVFVTNYLTKNGFYTLILSCGAGVAYLDYFNC